MGLFDFWRPKPNPVDPAIARLLDTILHNQRFMMSEIEDLVREVQETRGQTESAIAMIQGLKLTLLEMANSNVELATLKEQIRGAAADLDANEQNLRAAIEATPADPSA